MEIQKALQQKNISYAKRGISIGAIAGMLWGLGGVIIAMGFAEEPFATYATLGLFIVPLVGACLTDGFSAITTFFINLINGKAREYIRAIRTKPGRVIILASVFGGPVAMSGYYIGMYLAGPSVAMAVTATYPAVGAILARIFLKEKVSKNSWAGIVLCVLGAIIVSYVAPGGESYPNFTLGLVACILATLGWGLEGVIGAYGMDTIDPDIAIGIRWITSFLVYFVVVLPVVLGRFSLTGYRLFADVLTAPVIGILLAGAVINAISYFWYYNSMNMSGVTKAQGLMITYALWGVIFGWIIYGSATVTPNIIIGAIVIVVGALLVAGKPSDYTTIREY